MNQNELGLYDIYDMPYTPWWQQPWFYVVIVASIIILFFLLLFLLKYLTRTRITPREKALNALAALSPLLLKTQDGRRNFYFALSAILKKFLVEEYGYEVEGLTDQELVEFLENKKVESSIVDDIKMITAGATFIKFAGADAAQERMAHDLERLRKIVKNTPKTTTSSQ